MYKYMYVHITQIERKIYRNIFSVIRILNCIIHIRLWNGKMKRLSLKST